MKRYILLFILLLLPAHAFLDSLVDSSDVEDTVVSGLCDETYVLLQYSQDDDIIGVETVDTDDGTFETTFTPDGEDTYTIFASCAGDVDSVQICYGDCSDDDSDEDSGGDECEEYLDCGDWGECIDGERVRDCVYACSGETTSTYTDCSDTSTTLEDDTGSVNETCSESWSCKQWGECIDGTQVRECNDYNLCGTSALKPEESQSCVVEEPYVPEPVEPAPPAPVSYQEPRTETVYVPVEPEVVMVPAQTIDYKNFAIVGGIIVAVIVFIALSVMVVMHYMNAHASSSNDDEMIEFVKQERRAGIDEEQIRASLKDSGWHKDEIQHALDDTKEMSQENIAREGFEPPTSGL